jgi:hypothetical protein
VKKASAAIIHWVAEHVTHWLIGDTILLATGFASEEWIAHLAHALNLQDEVHKLWPQYLDLRAVFLAVGMSSILHRSQSWIGRWACPLLSGRLLSQWSPQALYR